MPEPATRERGIMFTAPMVRAILEGRKTQTRRVIKPPRGYDIDQLGAIDNDGVCFDGHGQGPEGGFDKFQMCPYGQPGDRLWVREAWAEGAHRTVAYRADGSCGACSYYDGEPVFYRHGYVIEVRKDKGPSFGLSKYGGKWKSPIFMPRWASRITLEFTDVRVERVQDISSADALAEGIRRATVAEQEAAGTFLPRADTGWFTYDGGGLHNTTAGAYAELWDSINGKTFPWASDPWVWALTFKRTEAARA